MNLINALRRTWNLGFSAALHHPPASKQGAMLEADVQRVAAEYEAQRAEPVAFRYMRCFDTVGFTMTTWLDTKDDAALLADAKRHGKTIEYAYAAQRVIPPGWQLVPKKPTDAMHDAAYIAYNDEGEDVGVDYSTSRVIWEKMCAAAPQQPTEKP